MIGIEDWPNLTSKISWSPVYSKKSNSSPTLKERTFRLEFHCQQIMKNILNILKHLALKLLLLMDSIPTLKSVSEPHNVLLCSTHCSKSHQKTHLPEVREERQLKMFSSIWSNVLSKISTSRV